MTHKQFRDGRLSAGWTQAEAAARLGVSQPYLSQLESGQRALTSKLARAATALYSLPATVLPMPESLDAALATDPAQLADQLASLGYPGLAHMRAQTKVNPAAVVVAALLQRDLDTRLTEALPWVLVRYPDLDWPWLVRHAKLNDLQNRLGFVTGLARQLAAAHSEFAPALDRLSDAEQQLERARLAREDTLCRESMPAAERRWLTTNRSGAAKHWNLLTSLSPDQLSHAV